MSVHQITIYFVIPLRRIQHESEFMNYQHLPCSLNILGAHTFNYFLHFNLELVIRIWFFFFFLQNIQRCFFCSYADVPPLAAQDSSKPDGWVWVITCHFVELFIGVIWKPLTMELSLSPYARGEIKAQSCSGDQKSIQVSQNLASVLRQLSSLVPWTCVFAVILPCPLQLKEVLGRGQWCCIFFGVTKLLENNGIYFFNS